MRRVGSFVGFFLLLAIQANAQINQIERFEMDQKGTDNAWTIISMKDRGLALVRDKEKFLEGQKVFQIKTLDTLLRETQTTEIGTPFRMKLIGYEYTGTHLYILLRSGESDLAEVLLLEYNLDNFAVDRYEIKHEFNFRLTHFTVLDRHAIFGGYVSKEPAVLIYDIAESQLKVVPGFFTSDTELLDLRINENNTFNTLVTNRSTRQNKSLVLRVFDAKGTQLMEDEIPIDQNKTILSGLTSALVRDELLIAGTYSVGNSKMASGFFSVLADPFKEQPIHYYDFAQLNHFLDYLTVKRADKIKATSRRFREKSKDPEFRANVSNVRLDEHGTGFYLLAEAYSTVTASNSGPYPYTGGYNGYYNPYMYGYSPFASRYYNSPYNLYNTAVHNDISMLSTSVLAFNPDGKLDWDHSMKVDDERKPSIEQAADFWCDRNKIVIAAKTESELVVKARFKNNESSGDTLKVLMKKPTDIVRDETEDEGGVRHWYGNKFYVWGYQDVRDPEMKFEDRNRSVFYIIKLDAY
ncbi:MAG TPA: hypothetical protein VFE50_18915 [Cyclobacteriaceae bacterium]|nr:hypothetical protein [Cyclobacteriaceae bacterium]